MKVYADLRVDSKKLETLAKSTQGIASQVSSEVSAEAVKIAKGLSRVDTGDMQKGWTRRRIGSGNIKGYRVYNTVPYTIYHELGTVKMTASPMLGPAMEAAIQDIPARVRKWIEAGTMNFINEAGDDLLLQVL